MSQVLALKYRPTSFDKLIGQDSVTKTLSLALSSNRLSHAYLFSGLRGSGKTSTARIFAKALVCEKGPTPNPCEECIHCQMANENRHIDIIEMDAASSRKIDDIRDLIEQTKYKPNSAQFKIFIIDEVHMLTKEAFNALLKTLEEPPLYVKFILATTDPLKLPPTILSRTQHYRFKTIARVDIVNHLAHILNLESVEYEEDALNILARAGNGSLRDTLTLLEQAIIYTKSNITAVSVASMLGILDPNQAEEVFKAILDRDRKKILEFVKEFENYECEVVIDELITYLKEAFLKEDSRFSTLISERFFRILSEAKNLLFLNPDNGFVLSIMFFKMLEATEIKTIDEMIETLESEKFAQPSLPSVQKSIEKTKKEEIVDSTNPSDMFRKLILKLQDRSFELGECFEKNIKFVEFRDNNLTWISNATGKDKEFLRHSYPIIRQFVQEIFGIDTKISMSQSTPKEEKKNLTEQPSSMIEEVEFPNSSCVASSLGLNSKESDAKEILNHPFVKKIQETFPLKEIKIYPKV